MLRHPQQLCLWSRRGFASPQSALSSLILYRFAVLFFLCVYAVVQVFACVSFFYGSSSPRTTVFRAKPEGHSTEHISPTSARVSQHNDPTGGVTVDWA